MKVLFNGISNSLKQIFNQNLLKVGLFAWSRLPEDNCMFLNEVGGHDSS